MLPPCLMCLSLIQPIFFASRYSVERLTPWVDGKRCTWRIHLFLAPVMSYDYRKAGLDSLHAAKTMWAKNLAQALVDHVSSGGWRSWGLDASISTGGRDVLMSATSDVGPVGFLIQATVDMDDQVVRVSFSKNDKNEDFFEFTKGIQRDDIKIDEHGPMEVTVRKVGLYWSKFINKLPRP